MTLQYLDDNKTITFESKLRSLIGLYYPQIDFRIAYKTPKKIGDFFKFKDTIPKDGGLWLFIKSTVLTLKPLILEKLNATLL
ncbi:unnamed protein product [Brachionus calyciflorus]|uniref:Uncharacterized protein n=1 Tax=Brachionus calyciflorus TaxID=104777 RepID=A0A813NTR7_9BILA|nr:unnamed protein product [Brachionus calyciflorus]